MTGRKDVCTEEVPKDASDTECELETIKKPIEFYISTWGGDALGMFAIYDLMRMVREECDISTFGIGKVMSAGVLLLAAGTKGERRVGKHTRIMMHAVRAGHYGALHSLENEMKETRCTQEQHIQALVTETKMTKRQIKTMLEKKIDVYFNAAEAVKFGIADREVGHGGPYFSCSGTSLDHRWRDAWLVRTSSFWMRGRDVYGQRSWLSRDQAPARIVQRDLPTCSRFVVPVHG